MGFESESGTAPEEQQGTTQTQPEGNGERSEKTFTQDEVNRIVSERLARDRAKSNEANEQIKDITDRETALRARELEFEKKTFARENDLPEEIVDILAADDAESFKEKAEKLKPYLRGRFQPGITTGVRSGSVTTETHDDFRTAFSLSDK